MNSGDQQQKHPPVIYTVWQEAWTAITKPSQYSQWTKQPIWRSIRYILFLLVVVSICATIFFYLMAKPYINEFKVWAVEELPKVTYQDNILSIEGEEAFTFTDSDKFYFKIDTTQAIEDEPFTDTFYEVGLLILKDGVIIGGQGENDVFYNKDTGVGNFEFTKEDVLPTVNKLTWEFFFFAPIIFLIYFVISKGIYVLLFALAAWVFQRKYPFRDFVSMAIYALTPAMLVGYLSFTFFGFSGLFSLVFVVYYIIAAQYYRRNKMSSGQMDQIK